MGRFTSLLSRSKGASDGTRHTVGGLRRLYHRATRFLHVGSPLAIQRSSLSSESQKNAHPLHSGPENTTEVPGLSSSASNLSDASGVDTSEPVPDNCSSVQLHLIGTRILQNFQKITSLEDARWPDTQRQLVLEGQRFLLWAQNLGLHRQGHASLDYRVRDATVVKGYLAEVLTELQDTLDNVLSIMKGERAPFEEGEVGLSETSDSSRGESDSDCQGSHEMYQPDRPRSSGSLHEVTFRHRSTTETIDSLYSLATRLRNPRNRPQRAITELYKHIPAPRRADYIREREALESMVVSHIHSETLAQSVTRTVSGQAGHGLNNEQLAAQTEVINAYALPSHFLIRRTGAANARRKQQFTYWKEHAARIGYNPATAQAFKDQKGKQPDTDESNTPLGAPQPHHEVDIIVGGAAPSSIPDRSLATSATRLEADAFMLEDLRSTISHQSRVTTLSAAPTWEGQMLDWPLPPEGLSNGDPPSKYFTCPYCHVICPQKYLETKTTWRSHLIHDLQPYHCTYENCPDPSRLYGSQQEWIDHENQHAQVWHCHQHGSEFETQRGYVDHLEAEHPAEKLKLCSPGLIDTAVGPSIKPRPCPFCPTVLDPSTDLRKHLKYHLERLALLVLPQEEEDDHDRTSRDPSDSHRVIQGRGRQSSLEGDFEDGSDWSSLRSSGQGVVDRTPKLGQVSSEIIRQLDREGSLGNTRPPKDGQSTRVSEWMAVLPARAAGDDINKTGSFENQSDNTATKEIPTNILPSKWLSQTVTANRNGAYTVAWICNGIRAEFTAARSMLDEIHDPLEPRVNSDDNAYSLGRIGRHNVVIMCPSVLTATSTAMVAMLQTFPSIRIAVMAGIGGAAPSYKHDIRLGDVVVGSPLDTEAAEGGVFGYSAGKARAGGEVEMVRHLDLPGILVHAVHVLKARYASTAGNGISETIRRVLTANSELLRTYTLPPPDSDILYDSTYIHSDITKTCTEVCADPLAKRIRAPRSADQENPAIHYGLIATSHLLMTDANARDRMSAEKGVLCFEMGSAGLMKRFPCLVVRGICDYSDSHKIKAWRFYAAMTAAAYTRDLLSCIDPLSLEAEPRIKDGTFLLDHLETGAG